MTMLTQNDFVMRANFFLQASRAQAAHAVVLGMYANLALKDPCRGEADRLKSFEHYTALAKSYERMAEQSVKYSHEVRGNLLSFIP